MCPPAEGTPEPNAANRKPAFDALELRHVCKTGHSLGAQIAAYASNECARPGMCGEPVHAIVAADPAGPCFELGLPEQRLDPTDAQHVIVVHTTETFGDENPVGTSDISNQKSQISNKFEIRNTNDRNN